MEGLFELATGGIVDRITGLLLIDLNNGVVYIAIIITIIVIEMIP